jgi:oligopeptide/dipeptide ABC transporter ATP-binding protein
MSMLEVRDLRTHLRTPCGVARAVDGVDLTVEEGEAVGIVGESGSGKSLLALSILGLVPRGIGEILPGSSIKFRDRDLVGAGKKTLRRVRGGEVAMVFQEPMTSLNPVFSLGSQLLEAVALHRGLAGKAAEEEATRLLREVGIPEPGARMRSYPHELSGGMRQRAMIAMALAGEPALLVADEPTTALDVTIQAQILSLLRSLQERRRMALLLISHDLRVVAQICQTLYVMYAGRIVERGPAADLFLQPRHPYTRGLLGSRLSLQDRRTRLRPIPGEVPEATAWPEGCRFRPRCPEAAEICGREPGLDPLAEEESRNRVRVGPQAGSAGGRLARCWFPGGAREKGP